MLVKLHDNSLMGFVNACLAAYLFALHKILLYTANGESPFKLNGCNSIISSLLQVLYG